MDTKKVLCSLVGEEIAAKFYRIAEENGTDAATVLSTFIMDYVVSGGHPETVGEKSQQEDTLTWLDRRWAEREKHRRQRCSHGRSTAKHRKMASPVEHARPARR